MDQKLANIPVIKLFIELGVYQEGAALSVSKTGTTYAMARQTCWVSYDHFAVGRWDAINSFISSNDSSSKEIWNSFSGALFSRTLFSGTLIPEPSRVFSLRRQLIIILLTTLLRCSCRQKPVVILDRQ